MNNFSNCMKADFYKLLHSRFLLLHLIAPILGILIFVSYYSYSPWNENDKLLIFIQTIALAFPLMIAISVSMIHEQEECAGNFQRILAAPYSKTIAHLSNLFAASLFGLFASLLTILGFGIVVCKMRYIDYAMMLYIKAALIVFASNFGLYVIQYIVSFSFGNGISLGLGIVGTLLSPLLYLKLGDAIWHFIPCGWGIRIATYFLYNEMNGHLSHVLMQDFHTGIDAIIVLTIIFIVGFVIWSNLFYCNKKGSW